MLPNKPKNQDPQNDLFFIELQRLVDSNHPLVRLSHQIDWEELEQAFGSTYCPSNGRRGCSTRLLVGLHYLKHTCDLSDEELLRQWVENPYWQYFCGEKFFQYDLPLDSSSLSRWRRRIAESGVEPMLRATIQAGLKVGLIRPKMLERVNVDTTVQEKQIRFPTDARLYDRMRQCLVQQAQREGIVLRQSYRLIGRKTLLRQSRYAHAQQFKRAARMTRKLKVILGRVVRDVRRKSIKRSPEIERLLGLADRLLQQQRHDRNKLYSIHEPEVECISKGKIQKRYEFGCKVSLVSSSRGNWVLGAQALSHNPYDGHSLASAIQQARTLSGIQPKEVYCDLGYRGHEPISSCKVQIVPRKRKHLARSLRRWMNRRAAIEPVIGHMKSEHRLGRNRLKGRVGDEINALLSACGYNIRKLLRAFLCLDQILTICRWITHLTKRAISMHSMKYLQHFIPTTLTCTQTS